MITGGIKQKKTANEILIKRSSGRRADIKQLRRALIEIGRSSICTECNNGPVWNNKPLVLHVDHIDGDSRNDSAENLRFLCPNCHTQTENFGSKKIRLYASAICAECNKIFTKRAKRIKDTSRYENGPFCDRSCAAKWQNRQRKLSKIP